MEKKTSAENRLTIFLERAMEIHSTKYDYSQITEQHINNLSSNVPIKCNICEYEWSPSINYHINGNNGCPVCTAYN